jgi:hypothetical protein
MLSRRGIGGMQTKFKIIKKRVLREAQMMLNCPALVENGIKPLLHGRYLFMTRYRLFQSYQHPQSLRCILL